MPFGFKYWFDRERLINFFENRQGPIPLYKENGKYFIIETYPDGSKDKILVDLKLLENLFPRLNFHILDKTDTWAGWFRGDIQLFVRSVHEE